MHFSFCFAAVAPEGVFCEEETNLDLLLILDISFLCYRILPSWVLLFFSSCVLTIRRPLKETNFEILWGNLVSPIISLLKISSFFFNSVSECFEIIVALFAGIYANKDIQFRVQLRVYLHRVHKFEVGKQSMKGVWDYKGEKYKGKGKKSIERKVKRIPGRRHELCGYKIVCLSFPQMRTATKVGNHSTACWLRHIQPFNFGSLFRVNFFLY